MTQGIFQKIFTLLEEACHELDLKLASHHSSDEHHGSYAVYAVVLQELNTTRAELDVTRQSASNLEQLVVYLSVTFGQSNPLLLEGLLDLSAEGRKHVQHF